MKLPKYSSDFIRRAFFDYFIKNDHKFIRSSPVVPFCDSTLSFVNAGMNQFKNVLLGSQPPPYPRVFNSQKCIRVGGKHNDLSNVGHDTYHHTFFEMLGNWSFGDYFKETACKSAWNFLTSPPISIPPERLFVTYFNGDSSLGLPPDLETKDIWLSIGVDENRLLPFGVKDNFWEMGMTGPCGSCTEIHYDYSANGNTNHCSLVNRGLQDVVELWNIVFVEYNRLEDGSLEPLSKQHVDTGLGFERFVAILQDKSSNYDTDLFTSLFDAISQYTGAPLYSGKFDSNDKNKLDTAYRIIADHTRMCTVALADNMFPDQNHKLRRVLRKALVIAENEFKVKNDYKLVQEIANRVSDSLSPVYPEISNNIKKIHYIIQNESELIKELKKSSVKEWQKIIVQDKRLDAFTGIEAVGLPAAYNELITNMSKDSIDHKVVGADLAVKLYDTFGLDVDLIEQLAQTIGYDFSKEKFLTQLTEFKRERTKKNTLSAMKPDFNLDYCIAALLKLGISGTDDQYKYNSVRKIDGTNSVDYEFPDVKANLQSVILLERVQKNELCILGNDVNLKNGEKVALVFDKTNFYSDAGGQLSDTGEICFVDKIGDKVIGTLIVDKVLKYGGYVLHIGKMKIMNNSVKQNEENYASVKENVLNLTIGGSDVYTVLKVDGNKRLSSMRNHTATHLINCALHKLLTVTCQKSSNVNSDHLVFDFGVYNDDFGVKDYVKLENIINELVKSNLPVDRNIISRNEFMALNDVILLPGEVYSDENICIIEIVDKENDFTSKEPCCGTHLLNTGDIDEFRLISVKNKGRNVKSVKAVTGVNAKITVKNDKVIMDEVDHYRSVLNDPSKRCLISKSEKQLNDFDKQLQNLKNEIKSSVDKKYFSYSVYHTALEMIDRAGRDVRIIARELLKKQLELEMKQVLTDLKLDGTDSNNRTNQYLIHFVKSSSNFDHTSLQKVTKMCPPDIPIMLFSYSETDNLLKGRCTIPKHMVSSFAADQWMMSVSQEINSKESIICGQDPKIVCGMKPKKIRKENLKDTVDKLVAKAETAVKSVLK